MKRALFIGRWQPLHPGHQWLFNQKLDKGIPILIAVRDTPIDESNPYSTQGSSLLDYRSGKNKPFIEIEVIDFIEYLEKPCSK